jgi:hypothetical protein
MFKKRQHLEEPLLFLPHFGYKKHLFFDPGILGFLSILTLDIKTELFWQERGIRTPKIQRNVHSKCQTVNTVVK